MSGNKKCATSIYFSYNCTAILFTKKKLVDIDTRESHELKHVVHFPGVKRDKHLYYFNGKCNFLQGCNFIEIYIVCATVLALYFC